LDNTFKLWIVKLGKLVFTGEIFGIPNDEDSFSFTFAIDEEVANVFIDEATAMYIANICGGTVIKKEVTSDQYIRLDSKNRDYLNREEEFEQLQSMGISIQVES
jgi:hypothetical protein